MGSRFLGQGSAGLQQPAQRRASRSRDSRSLPCSHRFLQPSVAFLFELQRQVFPAGLDDAAVRQNVNEVRNDIVQQPLVVRHHDDGALGTAQRIDAVRHDPQSVDVETRVGLVKDGEPRLEHGHLENFVPLLLSAREAFVHRPVHQAFVHPEQLHFLADHREEVHRVNFFTMVREKMKLLGMDESLMNRPVNEGFSGGEKKRNEIFQMAVLEPRLAILDETDSGLDIDALRIVANGVNSLRSPQRAIIVVTHYQRLLNYIVPDFVHVLSNGRIVKSGGKDLALELEEKGYGWLEESVAAGQRA